MLNDPVDKLLALASGPLGAMPSRDSAALGGPHGEDLAALLGRRNGFYAFESALHVFPSGTSDRMSIERWNEPDLWRHEYRDLTDGMVFFAEDIVGVQFALTEAGIASFDPETGRPEAIAVDLDSWVEAVLGDYKKFSGHPLGHAWQRLHGALPAGQRVLPKVPFVTGGAFEVENLYAADAVEGMRARGNLAMQIRDLPDGSKFTYRLVE